MKRLFLSIVLIFLLSQSGCSERVKPVTSIGYQPPLIPIKICYKPIEKTWKVEIHGKVKTAIGDFSINQGVSQRIRELKKENKKFLILTIGNRVKYYELNKNEEYKIILPTDYDGKSHIQVNKDDKKNIYVYVPNPTNKTVAQMERENYGLKREIANKDALIKDFQEKENRRKRREYVQPLPTAEQFQTNETSGDCSSWDSHLERENEEVELPNLTLTGILSSRNNRKAMLSAYDRQFEVTTGTTFTIGKNDYKVSEIGNRNIKLIINNTYIMNLTMKN